MIQAEEQRAERKKNSERPPDADIDRRHQQENARNQRANDGKAQENEGEHPRFRATAVPAETRNGGFQATDLSKLRFGNRRSLMTGR